MTGTLRLRLAACCVLLIGLAMVQDPGFLVADTKFDLVAAPGDFLSRALHLWDREGAFGQLQNQAYGYLWPMGSFFLAGALADVPGWVVQRLWLALVIVVAFWGAARLARALGVRSDLACIVSAFAFALSPRMLTTLGPISIEAWPSAVAPWVLLPLVLGSRSGSPRRAAALSALAVATVGGVNAAATFAVIPLGVVWLLTRTPGARRRALMFWWPVFTLLGTLWWLIPLFVMGAYSPPFLDFIETSAITTFPTTVFDVLRGTSNWVPYIDPSSRAGNDLLTTSYLALNSGVVLLLGFAGLLDRRTPQRRFLALSLLLGLLMVSAGHQGSVQGWFAAPTGDLLDGVLSPLRNVHKFDVIVRLPLVLGLAFALDRVLTRRVEAEPTPRSLVRLNQVVFASMALLAVAGASLPAVQGRIEPQGATVGVPAYWTEAADWLEEASGDNHALLLPGTGFADYVWGSLRDEPLQYLANSRWAVRNAIPLAPAGNIRMLDGIEDRLAQGRGSPGLTLALARAGVRYLVVRNDLARGTDVPDPVLVHQALVDSPGLQRVASFGPDLGGDGHLEDDEQRVLVNGGWQAVYPAIEIFEVPGSSAAASGATLPVVAAGPEDLADLADLDVLGTGPVQLAADADKDLVDAATTVVLTDGLRARERSFARIHDGASAVIGPGDVRRSGNPTRDYLIDSGDRWSTTVAYRGAAALAASSSASDAGEAGGAVRGRAPYAALDDRKATQWVSGFGRAAQSWWSVTLDEQRTLTSVRLTGGAEAAEDQVVRVRTDRAVTETIELGPGVTRTVQLDGSPTGTLRVEDAQDTTLQPLALAEVDVPGVRASRTLVLPELPQDWGVADRIALRADDDARTGCAEIGLDVRCVIGRSHAAEEPQDMDRTIPMAGAATYDAALMVRPRPGNAIVRQVLRDQALAVDTSTVGVPDVRASGLAAVDGNPGTAWIADLDDARPTIALSWLGTQSVSGLSLTVDPDSAARRPTRVTLSWPEGTRTVSLQDGRATFPTVRTDQLRIQVEDAEDALSLGFDGQASRVPIGVGEVRLTGMPYAPLALSLDEVTHACGVGPKVTVNGFPFATRITAAPAQLAAGTPVPAELCLPGSETSSPVVLRPGENVVRTSARSGFTVRSLVLTEGSPASAPIEGAGLATPDAVSRTLTPAPGSRVVVMRENANRGWHATADGKTLRSVVVDGWQQGWLLPSDSSVDEVEARYTPDPVYRGGLLAGFVALCLLLLALILLLVRRRPGPAPLEERHLPWPLALGVIVVAPGLLAGWPGLAVGVAALAVVVVLDRRAPEAAPLVLGALCLVAALDYAVTPWGSPSGWAGSDRWPHYVALVPVLALMVSALLSAPSPGGGPDRWGSLAFFRRRAGRSTTR